MWIPLTHLLKTAALSSIINLFYCLAFESNRIIYNHLIVHYTRLSWERSSAGPSNKMEALSCTITGCTTCGERQSIQGCNTFPCQLNLECDSCSRFQQAGEWKFWTLHESFSDLEKSASKGCQSCQLVWKMIVYDTPSLAGLNRIRSSKDKITIMGDLENCHMKEDWDGGYLCVAYGTGSCHRLPIVHLNELEPKHQAIKSK